MTLRFTTGLFRGPGESHDIGRSFKAAGLILLCCLLLAHLLVIQIGFVNHLSNLSITFSNLGSGFQFCTSAYEIEATTRSKIHLSYARWAGIASAK